MTSKEPVSKSEAKRVAISDYDVAAFKLTTKQHGIRERAIAHCKIFIDNPDVVKFGGYKSEEDAVMKVVKGALKQLDDAMKKFEKEWPCP